jgi:hypothetical protein
MINLRVEVQRCPAVPTAPKTAPGTVIFISASGVTMIALFPPNSNNDFPNVAAQLALQFSPFLLNLLQILMEFFYRVVIISPTL